MYNCNLFCKIIIFFIQKLFCKTPSYLLLLLFHQCLSLFKLFPHLKTLGVDTGQPRDFVRLLPAMFSSFVPLDRVWKTCSPVYAGCVARRSTDCCYIPGCLELFNYLSFCTVWVFLQLKNVFAFKFTIT